MGPADEVTEEGRRRPDRTKQASAINLRHAVATGRLGSAGAWRRRGGMV